MRQPRQRAADWSAIRALRWISSVGLLIGVVWLSQGLYFDQPLHAQTSGYTVEGNIIRDPQGQPIQLHGINWFGFETQEHVVHGLWARNWQSMIVQMKELGFNAIRVPFCPATLQASSVSSINYGLNPDLAGKNSLEILDLFLTELDAQGFYILLDHHRPDCNAISELWYTGTYSEAQWIADLVFVAQRYSHLPHFFGIDLKNEPHGPATWGTGNAATDWNSAAERAGNAVLAVNPNLVIFVEGIGENPTCSSNINHWWGGNIEPFECAPIQLNIPGKVVLSPHVYGPDVYNQPYFQAGNFPANLPAIWEQHFGRFATNNAVVIGEFGGRYGHGGDAKDKIWQDTLVDYLIDKGMRSGFYWSWNPNSGDTGGILQDDWTSVWDDKVQLLHRLWGLSAGTPTATPTPTNTNSAPTSPTATATATNTSVPSTATTTATPIAGGACQVTYTITNDWGHGFTADVTLHNNSGSTWQGWQVQWTFAGNQQITNLWNGTLNQSGQAVTVTQADWNGSVPHGSSVTFGFQASYSGSNLPPSGILINGSDCSNPGPTATPSATDSVPATATGTATSTATATSLPTNTATPTPSATPTATSTPLPTATSTPTVEGSLSCTVYYEVNNDWGNGFVTNVVVTNLSGAPWQGWNVTWSFAGNQQITNLWNGALTQNNQHIQVANATWNGAVPANSSVSFGFQAAYSGANPAPTAFQANGQPCSLVP
jgi:endoglucanase